MPDTKQITVTLTKSPIGYAENQHRVVKALGLGKLHSSKTHFDTPTIRGMVNKIRHLVTVTE